MKKNPKISICCPCYESESFITETIQSFINQSYENLEIIISDDCSKDRTYDIIKNNFNDTRIKLFKQKQNIGPSLNLQFCIDRATSDYIALCAGDDLMHIDRIKNCYNFMLKNPDCDMVHTFVNIINNKSDIIQSGMQSIFNQDKTTQEMLRYFYFNGNFICAPSVMIKKNIFNNLKFNPCLLQLQDFDMWVRILLNNFKIKCLPEKLTNYRIHGNNLSINSNKEEKNNIISRDCFEHVKVLHNFIKYLDSTDKFEKLFGVSLEDNKLIPFQVAKFALDLKKRSHYLFALDVIYNEMLDQKKRELIANYYDFNMKDFYELCNNFVEKKQKKTNFLKKVRLFLKN